MFGFGDFDLEFFLIRIPPLLFALRIHEFAHAWSAYLCGDPTAKLQGRLTLDPLAHLDPIGTLCMLFAGFGWAKPVPVNPYNFRYPRRDDILVSLAGVGANLATALTVALVLNLTSGSSLWASRAGLVVWKMLLTLLIFSLGLLLFNLLPVPPLDGSHVLENLLPRDAAMAYPRLRPYAPLLLAALILTHAVDGLLGWALSGLLRLLLSA